MIKGLQSFLDSLPPVLLDTTIITLKTVFVLIVLILCVAFTTLLERKIIGFMQARIGPNRVGYKGLLQPFADTLKLLLKEIIIPRNSNRFLFVIAPLLSIIPAFATWAVISFSPDFELSNINAGLLYALALTSFSVYGVILAGWATNSKYAFLGAMRSGAQMVAYEIAMGFALVGVLMAAGSLNLGAIIAAQSGSIGHWFLWPLFPLFVVYFVSGLAETNRAPFDVAEGESEIVAGFHVEYSGIGFALFFLAEYANILLICVLVATLFMGGWLSPFEGLWMVGDSFLGRPGFFWLAAKSSIFLFFFLWFRATFPRYRYDQIMRLGWKVFIPITIVWLTVIGVLIALDVPPWFDGV